MSRRLWGWGIFLPLLAIIVNRGGFVMFLPAYVISVAGTKLIFESKLRPNKNLVVWIAVSFICIFLIFCAVTVYAFGVYFKRKWGLL